MSSLKGGGIYLIRNTQNGNFYIGSAVCFSNRWAVHRRALRKGDSGCRRLQNAWNLYGEQAFVFEVLEHVCAAEHLIEIEQGYLDALSPPYNICKVAGSALGTRHSQETRIKMSDRKKGPLNPFFGRTGSDHPRFNKGHSAEHKAQMSKKHSGASNPMYGVRPAHAKLETSTVRAIKDMLSLGISGRQIADFFGISSVNVSQIKTGRSYASVGQP